MAPRDELPGHVKAFIVQRLACFDTPTQVAKAVKDEFDLTVTRQRVHYYDPTHRMGAALMPDLAGMFHQTREKFLKDPPRSPIAELNYRLARLQRALDLAETRGQLPEVRAILEQAAQEIGGRYTNKVKLEHTGEDGGPIEVRDARTVIAERLDAIASRAPGGPAAEPAGAGAGGPDGAGSPPA